MMQWCFHDKRYGLDVQYLVTWWGCLFLSGEIYVYVYKSDIIDMSFLCTVLVFTLNHWYPLGFPLVSSVNRNSFSLIHTPAQHG